MLSFDNSIGLSAGILTGISMLPQLVKIIRERKAKEVSAIMIGILLCGLGLWVYCGVLKNDFPIIITNTFSFLISLLVLFFKLLCHKTVERLYSGFFSYRRDGSVLIKISSWHKLCVIYLRVDITSK